MKCLRNLKALSDELYGLGFALCITGFAATVLMVWYYIITHQ